MSSADLRVNCPHCGSVAATSGAPTASPDGHLKDTTHRCADCENDFELYYY